MMTKVRWWQWWWWSCWPGLSSFVLRCIPCLFIDIGWRWVLWKWIQCGGLGRSWIQHVLDRVRCFETPRRCGKLTPGATRSKQIQVSTEEQWRCVPSSIHKRRVAGFWQKRRFVPGHCRTVMAAKPISKIWTVSSVTTSAVPGVVMVRILLLLAQCKGHWQAHNLSMVGGVAQKKSMLLSMQMMNRLPRTCTNNSGGAASLKATSSQAGGTVIRFALLEEWFDEPMTIRMAAQKNAIPLPLGSAGLLLGTDNTYNNWFFYIGNLRCLVFLVFTMDFGVGDNVWGW